MRGISITSWNDFLSVLIGVALVADDAQGLEAPRRILEVAPGRFWLIDMGANWVPKKGRLLELTLPPGAARASVRTLADKLDRQVLKYKDKTGDHGHDSLKQHLAES